MANFVGLLKRTIDAQSNATPELRQRIYDRARETVEKKLAESNVAPEIIALQRKIMERAINQVEALCLEADEEAGVFSGRQEEDRDHPGMQPPAEPRGVPFVAGHETAGVAGGKNDVLPAKAPASGYAASSAYPDVTGADEQEFAVESQEILPDAMFSLPETTGSEALSASMPPDDQPLAGSRFQVPSGGTHFVDDTFPPALEALSADSASAPSFLLEQEQAPSVLPDMQGDTAERFWQEKDVAAGNGLLPEAGTEHDIAPFDLSASFQADGPGMFHDDVYESVPEFLLNDESAAISAQNGPEAGTDGYDREDAAFTEVLPVGLTSHEQEEANTSVLVTGGPVDGKADDLQEVPFFAVDAGDAVMPDYSAAADQVALLPAAVERESVPAASDEDQKNDDLIPLSARATERPEAGKKNDDFSMVSGIFAQAAIREKRRSGKKRLLAAAAIIIAILCIVAAIIWFLTGFLHQEEPETAAPVAEVEDSDSQKRNERSAKITQRLLPDGQETNPGPAQGSDPAAGEGTSETTASRPAGVAAPAILREAQTAILPETLESGTVKWSLLHERDENGREMMAVRGDVSFPTRDMVLRMTIRQNHDSSIPAAYLIELIFVVPENFEGGAVDQIGPLLFKASEQSAGQALQGAVPLRIDDNFFILALNTPRPFLNRNLDLMRQLPWMHLQVVYKNGRVGTLSFAKGKEGDAVFNQGLQNIAENAGNQPEENTGQSQDMP